MRSEIYKDHYEFEWSHRSHLTAALNIPIAVATVLGGGITVVVQKFPYEDEAVTYVFVLLVSMAVLSLVLAIAFLFFSFLGYQYQRIPTPLKIKEHHNQLIDWWKKNGGGEKEARKDLDEFIDLRMGEAVEVNSANNRKKSAFLYKTNLSLAVTFILLGFSVIPYAVKTIGHDGTVYRVEIVSPANSVEEESKMSDQKPQKPTTDEKPATPVAPPQKPLGPPNENIKEHKEKPEPRIIINEREQ